MNEIFKRAAFACVAFVAVVPRAEAHKLEPSGLDTKVANSFTVTPSVDWNSIGSRQGKQSEVWTLDGENLNELVFYGGVRSSATISAKVKKVKLPVLQEKILLIDILDLIERTYRQSRGVADFKQGISRPQSFLGQNGIAFGYEYVNRDGLHMGGSAVAGVVKGQLYMILINAPKLHYFERAKPAFDAIVASARL